MATIIKAKNIIKTYGEGEERRRVIDGVSMSIDDGDFVAIMGPSGSGKSTLVYALSGMDKADEGSISFEGRELASCREPELADLRRTRMGFVFQQPTMLRILNIRDNIMLPAAKEKGVSRAELCRRAAELMEKVGIQELGDREISQVSGGQLQRAGICRALINMPRILFGDEPTGALNSKATGEILELLTAVNAGGTAVLLVTHDARVAARTDRILFMVDGKIASELELGRFAGVGEGPRIEAVATRMRSLGI